MATSETRRLRKILVANRGEIARRVLRSAREMGIATVAVYSDADANAPHTREADEAVFLGPAPSAESYLSIDRVIEAAQRVSADAIHPGYGFLSENPALAERCDEAGIVFIGPSVDALRKLGNKREAKAILAAAGVPVIPGSARESSDDAALEAEARELGLPLLVKAAAGGGGRGMRTVRDADDLPEVLAAARREAGSAFGDDALLLERYLERARHIEVQIFGDTLGNVIHLFERECSVQRRFQKIIEDAPSAAVDDRLRGELGAAAVAAGKAVGYVGAGTVEFLVDTEGRFYCLEVNARLQVEHPVTEAITGLDLVRWQIRVAQGEPLPKLQEDLELAGCAVEARLYAEDPSNDFLPATGRLALWRPPAGIRVDSGVERGSEVGIHYDPLLAKLIAHGETRADATRRLVRGLRELGVGGVTNNRDFLIAVLEHPAYEAGELDTDFLARHFPDGESGAARDRAGERLHAIAAAIHAHEERRGTGPLPASIPSGWRNNRWRPQDVSYEIGDENIEVRYVALPAGRFEVEAGGESSQVVVCASDPSGAPAEPGAITLEIDGVRRAFSLARQGSSVFVHGPGAAAGASVSELIEVPRFPRTRAAALAGGCLAPMPGIVRQVNVQVGDRVEDGTVLAVLEAMKMEHPLAARAPGVVKEVRVSEGQTVEPDQVLIVLEAAE